MATGCNRDIPNVSSDLTSAVSVRLAKLLLPGELPLLCKGGGDPIAGCGVPGTDNIDLTNQNDLEG